MLKINEISEKAFETRKLIDELEVNLSGIVDSEAYVYNTSDSEVVSLSKGKVKGVIRKEVGDSKVIIKVGNEEQSHNLRNYGRTWFVETMYVDKAMLPFNTFLKNHKEKMAELEEEGRLPENATIVPVILKRSNVKEPQIDLRIALLKPSVNGYIMVKFINDARSSFAFRSLEANVNTEVKEENLAKSLRTLDITGLSVQFMEDTENVLNVIKNSLALLTDEEYNLNEEEIDSNK